MSRFYRKSACKKKMMLCLRHVLFIIRVDSDLFPVIQEIDLVKCDPVFYFLPMFCNRLPFSVLLKLYLSGANITML